MFLSRAFRLSGCLLLSLALGFAPTVVTAETLPPAPPAFFNDFTGQISATTTRSLNQRLEAYERESSNQLLVAIYDRMDSPSSIQDYTYRVAESWQVGQGDRNNGAVLFVFLGDRKMFLQVGYGLEGVLPDVLAKRIVEDDILPRFRRGDLSAGMTAGVEAMIAATRGEYTGSGRTASDRNRGHSTSWVEILFILILVVLSIVFRSRRQRRYINGRGHHHHPGWWIGGGGGGRSGGSGFGGGGGFSGGGGSFGGGGAGGSW